MRHTIKAYAFCEQWRSFVQAEFKIKVARRTVVGSFSFTAVPNHHQKGSIYLSCSVFTALVLSIVST